MEYALHDVRSFLPTSNPLLQRGAGSGEYRRKSYVGWRCRLGYWFYNVVCAEQEKIALANAKIGALTDLSLVAPSERKKAPLLSIISNSAGEKPPSGPVSMAVASPRLEGWLKGVASLPFWSQAIKFPLKLSKNSFKYMGGFISVSQLLRLCFNAARLFASILRQSLLKSEFLGSKLLSVLRR